CPRPAGPGPRRGRHAPCPPSPEPPRCPAVGRRRLDGGGSTGRPQPRGVEELEDGAVTQAGPRALRPKIEKLLRLVFGKKGGQAFRELGAPDLPRGIQLHHAPPGEELEAAPHGGELPRDRALGELA